MGVKKITVANPELTDPVTPGVRADKFRSTLGYWASRGPGGTGIHYIKDPDLGEDFVIEEISEIIELPTPSNQLQTYRQQITISEKASGTGPRGTGISDLDQWSDKVKFEIATFGVEFTDLVSTVTTEYTNEEALVSSAETTANNGVDYIYNFYDRKYEDLLESVVRHEDIPSIYAETNKVYLEPELGEVILKKTPVEMLTDSINTPSEMLLNQITPIESTGLLDEFSKNKFLFPMYNDINIRLDDNNEIANIVEDSGLGVILTRDVEGVTVQRGVTVGSERMIISNSLIDSNGDLVEDVSDIADTTTVNLMDWLDFDSGKWASGMDPVPDNFTVLGEGYSGEIGRGDFPAGGSMTTGTDPAAFHLALGQNEFFDRFYELTKQPDYRRSFQDLMDGKEAYSEILMYKIEKYLGPPTSGNSPIQTFHFMNITEVRDFLSDDTTYTTSANPKIKFTDTQVKYGQEYTYIVVAYQVTLGMKYEYEFGIAEQEERQVGIASSGPPSIQTFNVAKIFFDATPLIKLIEIPLFISSGQILDKPPLEPEVAFNPYFGITNQLLMSFTTKSGATRAIPFALNDREERINAQLLLNQSSTDGLLEYTTDDNARAFIIYRTSAPPMSYEDFAGQRLRRVNTIPGSSINQRMEASSANAIVKQRPNRKFYYMFRTVDRHGSLSNPSPVYEIELYSDKGVGYPIIRQYEFTEPDPKTPVKSAKKIIQIVPRITQAFLNEQASGLIDSNGDIQSGFGKDLVLGVEDESLFGKRFKVRLTSKKTGKKLDINIDFKTDQGRTIIE